MAVIELNNLSKNFGGLRALDDVNLEVDSLEIRGLIGPNGARKREGQRYNKCYWKHIKRNF